MVLRKGQLVCLFALAALFAVGAGITADGQYQPRIATLLALVAALSVVYALFSLERYRFYQSFGLISLNSKLSVALYHLREGGVGKVHGRLYYHSHGKKRHRTPWPRIWVMSVDELKKLRVGGQADILALVIWPVPFLGGIRHCRETICVRRDGFNSYSLHPEPVERHKWRYLRQLNDQELVGLARNLLVVLTDLNNIHDSQRIGTKRYFPLDT